MNKYLKWIWDVRNIDENKIREHKKHYYSFLEFIDSLVNTSPSFQDLWDIAEFIEQLEYTYFYNNSLDSDIHTKNFASTRTNKGFDINYKDSISNNKVNIKCKLNIIDQKITIEVKRNSNPNDVTTMVFKDEKWVSYKNDTDEVLLDNIIRIIWDKFIKLIKPYYLEYNKYYENEIYRYRLGVY